MRILAASVGPRPADVRVRWLPLGVGVDLDAARSPSAATLHLRLRDAPQRSEQ
jgi:hypothetical protein